MLPFVGAAHMRYNPNAVSIEPAKMSPNMTPNKKGNVTAVNTPGLASLNLGVSYELMTSYGAKVKSLSSKKVGIVSSGSI